VIRFKLEPDDVLISYDPDAHAMYVQVRQARVAKTQDLGNEVHVDLDSHGGLIGIEVISPGKVSLNLQTVIQRLARQYHVPALAKLRLNQVPRVLATA